MLILEVIMLLPNFSKVKYKVKIQFSFFLEGRKEGKKDRWKAGRQGNQRPPTGGLAGNWE